MASYRKKPVVIEAVQWYPGSHVEGVCVGPCARNDYLGETCPHVHTIHRGGGVTVPVEPEDWIIREPDGIHFYACKPDIFAATYEPVDATAPAVAGLDDEALATVLDEARQGWIREHPTTDEMIWDDREYRRLWIDRDKDLGAALREHIFRVLASQAGDPQALAKAAYDAHPTLYRGLTDFGDHSVAYREGWRDSAQAVAARVAARYAAEVAALREALEDALDSLVTQNQTALSLGEPSWVYHACERIKKALGDPSPLVRLIEAEARLGRAVCHWSDVIDRIEFGDGDEAEREYDAALAALRALKAAQR